MFDELRKAASRHADVVLDVASGLLVRFRDCFAHCPKRLALDLALRENGVGDDSLFEKSFKQRLEKVGTMSFILGVGIGKFNENRPRRVCIDFFDFLGKDLRNTLQRRLMNDFKGAQGVTCLCLKGAEKRIDFAQRIQRQPKHLARSRKRVQFQYCLCDEAKRSFASDEKRL